MNKNAEEERAYNLKMQEQVARAEFMELAKNLHRNYLNRLNFNYQLARYI